jgi:predicted transposase/invertase (TIGR01784 family)
MNIPFLLFPSLRRQARENVKQGLTLDILSDFVFKTLFTADDEDSREACRLLLSACIRRPVASLSIRNNEILPDYLTGKTIRLDIHLTFNDGDEADLEMQMKRTGDNLKVRATIYAAKLLAGQAKRGEAYAKVKRVYQIFFLNFILFPGSEKIPRRYTMQEEDEHDNLSDVMTVIFYELPKLERIVQECLTGKRELAVLPAELKWGIYFRCRNDKKMGPVIEELCREEDGIMKAERALKRISREEEQWARNLFREKASMDYASGLYDARQKGLAEGREKGRAEGTEKGRQAGLAEGRKETEVKYRPILEEKDRVIEALRRQLREAGKDSDP